MIEAAKLEADIYPAGPRGLSAYEIYKKEGGQLSEEEWLKSLNGLTPTIGENGNWFLGTVDTGLPSRGPKGDTGSIKFIVVTELPTENIDGTAIYLKPVESQTGENNFEELIYVNGKWEDLGTPNVAVDLSNYYTKEETDVIIPAILCIKELGGYFNTARPLELSEDNKKRFSEFVNKHPNEPFLVYIFDYYHVSYCMDLCYFSLTGGPTTTGKNSTVQYVSVSGNNNESKGLGKIVYSYSLDENNIITFTKIKILLSDVYYPTKKYVDDAVVAKQDVLTAGDNITISEENVISAKGGDKLHDYNIYTITLDDYNLKGTFPTITDTTTLAKFDEILTDIYKKRIAANATHDNAFLIVYSKADTFIFRTNTIQASYCFLYGTYIEEPIDISGYTNSYQFYITGTLDTTAQTFKTTKVQFDRNSKRVLLTNNTLSYTPTGDYNPATKKYVDDQVATKDETSLIFEWDGKSSSTNIDNIALFQNVVDSIKDGKKVLIYNPIDGTSKPNDFPHIYVPANGDTITEETTSLYFKSGFYDLESSNPVRGLSELIRKGKRVEVTLSNYTVTNVDAAYDYSYIVQSENASVFIPIKAGLSDTTYFTPTYKSQPASKGYVDDAITTAITTTLGGSY